MTKSRLNLALLISALAIGTLAALYWPPLTSCVSLCSIALNTEPYTNQHVDITANLYSYSNGVMHLNGIECGPRSDAWATLEFDSSFLPTAMDETFLENIRDVTQQSEYKMAQVRLRGRIEDLERQCFGPRFILYATQLEQVSEIGIGNIEQSLH